MFRAFVVRVRFKTAPGRSFGDFGQPAEGSAKVLVAQGQRHQPPQHMQGLGIVNAGQIGGMGEVAPAQRLAHFYIVDIEERIFPAFRRQ